MSEAEAPTLAASAQNAMESHGPYPDPSGIPALEMTILGAMIMDPEAVRTWQAMTCTLRNPMALMAHPASRIIAKGILDLIERGLDASYTALIDDLVTKHQYHIDTPLVRAHTICATINYVVNTRHIDTHIRLLFEAAKRRALKIKAEGLALASADPNADIDGLMEAAMLGIKSLTAADLAADTPTPDGVLALAESMLAGQEHRFVKPSIAGLYRLAGAWPRGQLSVIAAPPGVGKTAFLLEQAFHAVTAQGLTVLAYLMESDEQQVLQRFCGQRFGIDLGVWKQRPVPDDVQKPFLAACRAYTALGGKFYKVLQKPMSGPEIEADVMAFAKRNGRPPDVVVADHFQTMTAPSGHRGASSDHAAIHENVMAMWRVAVSTGAAVLAASQLDGESKRMVERGQKKRPSASDLKGSQTIVEKAKVILFVHEPQPDPTQQVYKRELIVAKSNDGGVGIIPALYVPKLTLHLADNPTDKMHFKDVLTRYGHNEGDGWHE